MSITQYQTHREAAKRLSEIYTQPHNILFVHYSCESFHDIPDGRSPRITSIAVRYLGSGQTKSFSIHQLAELEGQLGNIKDKYDTFERKMLDAFYEFARAADSTDDADRSDSGEGTEGERGRATEPPHDGDETLLIDFR